MKRSFVLLVGLTMSACLGAGEVLPPPQLDWNFTGGFKECKLVNYGDKLDLEVAVREGEHVFHLENRRAKATPFTRKDGVVVMHEADTSFAVSSPRFKVTPSLTYAVKIRARGTVRMDGPSPAPAVVWYDEGGQPLKTRDALGKDISFTSPFTMPVKADVWTTTVTEGVAPGNAAFAELRISADQPNVEHGQWLEVSSVQYYERKRGDRWTFGDYEPPKVERLSPSPCADGGAAVVFKVTDPSGVDGKSVVCRLDGEEITSQIDHGENGELKFVPKTPWAMDTVHEFTVSAADKVGNVGEDAFFVCVAEPGARRPVLALRDDGMPLKDGKPFFPVAIMSVGKCPLNGMDVEAGVRELKANGFNLVASYAVRTEGRRGVYEDLADACEKHDLFLRLEPAPRQGADREKRLVENLLEGRRRRCVFSWCLGDDTAMHRTPADVRRDNLLCKAIDPMTFTAQIDICHYAGRFAPYVPFADCHCVEVYPIIELVAQADELPKIVRDLRFAAADIVRAAAGPRYLESMIQSFSGWTLWKRYPSFEELRAMTILSIAAGARGVSYYTYFSPNGEGAASTRERLEDLFRITRELAEIKTDLAACDYPRKPETAVIAGPKVDALGQPSVTCLLKATGLLIAASSAAEPITVRFGFGKGHVFEHTFPRNGVLIKRMLKGQK